jgi:hypothetical protein
MSEYTSSLAALRRAIASELQMPFARRFDAGTSALDASSTTSHIIDAALNQKDAFWNGSWFYHPSTQSISLIRSFSNTTKAFELETPLASTPTTGDAYEIHSIFNAADIRKAINRAINSAVRVFSDSVIDNTLILQENVLTYSLTGLTKKPWIVNKVWLENKPASRGTLVSAGATSFTTPDSGFAASLNSPVTNYIISIYAGTGKGQQRNLATASGAGGTVAAWTTVPDSTSKYTVWDASYEIMDWSLLAGWRLDAKEYPDTLFFSLLHTSMYGMRIRLEYLGVNQGLTAEADTTIVPSEYIIPKAIAFLLGARTRDTKVDRDTFLGEASRYDQIAEAYLLKNTPQKPDTTLKSLHQTEFWTEEDPMNWRSF